MRRSTKRLAAAVLIAALGILSACGTSAAPETTPLPTSEPTAVPDGGAYAGTDGSAHAHADCDADAHARPDGNAGADSGTHPGGAHAHARPARPGGNVHLCGRGRRRMEAGAAQRRAFHHHRPGRQAPHR